MMESETKAQINTEKIENQTQVEASYQAALARWKRLQTRVDEAAKFQSQTVFPLSESQKAQLQRLRDQLAEAQTQVDAAFQRRLAQGNLSIAPFLHLVEKDEAKSHELRNLVTELNQKLGEAESLRMELEKRPPAPSAEPTVAESPRMELEQRAPVPSTEPTGAGDVDMEQPSMSFKRRRLSFGFEDTTSPSAAQITKEIKELHNTLKEVLERISNVENSQFSQEDDVREVLQTYLHDRTQSEELENSTRINHIHEQTMNIESQLSELSSWVDEAHATNAKIEDQQKVLMEQKDKEESDIRNLLARVEEHEKNHYKDKKEIEALSAALSAYREKPVSPPSSPFDPETIVSDMEDQIKELVRSAIKPQIDESRSILSNDLRMHDSELFTVLWSKLSLTHKVITAVAEATKQPPAS